MFGGDDDPFGTFSMFNHMHRQMRDMDRMMESMMDPFNMFGGMTGRRMDGRNMIENGGRAQQRHQELAHPLAQFGMGGFGLGGMFSTMNSLQQQAMNDPNSHVFTHCSTTTFDEYGRPQVVEKSVRKTGDVKEERRVFRNDEKEEIAIGHHLGDRSHIIEKKRDKDGNVRKQQKFINLDEDAAEAFDTEFQSRARANLYGKSNGGSSRQALEDGHRARSSHAPSNSRTTQHSSGSSNAPIITLPEEEEEAPRRYRSRHSSAQPTGPIIREISEEEAESSISKKRRGPFGAFRAND